MEPSQSLEDANSTQNNAQNPEPSAVDDETGPSSESSAPNPQVQVIPYRNRGRMRSTEADYLEMVRWCVGHSDIYRTKSRSVFWADLRIFALETLKRDIKYPDRLIARLVTQHRKTQAAELTKSGVAVSETDLN